MKSCLVRIANLFLAMLPAIVANKLRLIAHVLLESWEVPPKFPHSENFQGKIPADWQQKLAGTDPQSIAEVADFFRRIENDLLMWKDDGHLRFIVRSDIAFSELLPAPARTEVNQLRRRYHLHGDYESLVAHHGVALLPDSVRSALSGKAFVDAGACVGASTIPLILTYNPSVVYAIEPNPRNGQVLQNNLCRNHIPTGKCEILPFAVGGENKTVRFDDSGMRVDVPGDCEVRMSTLDDLLYHKNIPLGLIKADIEGMGAEMLAGARRLIGRDHPVLALSCYHTPEELFGQFLFLQREFPFYRLSFTALPPGSGWELTMLAVPND